MNFARRCGAQGPSREAACAAVDRRIQEAGIETVRVAWADLHGSLRGKALVCGGTAHPVADALEDGLGMVSTILLKDTSDRTAFQVFEPGALAARPELAGFGAANNLLLLPDPASFTVLPWAPRTGWLRAEPFWPDGTPVAACPRRALQRALAALAAHEGRGLGLRCGLELEFHVYRITDDRLDPEAAAWPAEPPALQMIHPGYNLLSENWGDGAQEALAIVRHTALGLGLPLRSLEIELGPSQVEAVFSATDALPAADDRVRFKNGVRQALRRAGYHATFVCRPPFAAAIASGWHLHQSLSLPAHGQQPANAMRREAPAGSDPRPARQVLSDTGAHWLAGLLAHAPALAALCAPTLPAYARFQGSLMAPQAAHWGHDNRGAMLRVVGEAGDAGTRIENRLGEPMANPYLAMAAQVWAGLDGLQLRLEPPPATEAPYGPAAVAGEPQAAGPADGTPPPLPRSLGRALDALAADPVLRQGLGEPLWAVFDAVKRQECARHAAAEDKLAWERREYFSRF